MFFINATIRKKKGKGASRRLRADNKCPAIIYGGQGDSICIELDHDKLWNIQKRSEFYSEVLTICINGNQEKVKVKSIQRNAYKPKLIHIDFIRV